eukprot:TRINITY_DN4088_c0_g3_i1.p1 TRINITY_DN4088_c0_g3~~TRINITY_DN4088_c0_g3_i1.p1  ORF type:complete len:243 (-),score=18.66 TRINITY_DN4088_c0_g3_i1:1006-1707(-)
MSNESKGFKDAANALIVGASLIASVTFGGFLQPPIGSAFDSYRSWVVGAFWSFNTLSFFFAACTLVMSIRIVMPKPRQFIEVEVRNVRRAVAFTTYSLIVSAAFVIGAFVMTGLGNLPPNTFLSMLLSTVLGVLFTMLFAVIPLLKDLFELFQRHRKERSPGGGGLLTEGMQLFPRRTCYRRELPIEDKLMIKWKIQQAMADKTRRTRDRRRPLHPHGSLPSRPRSSIFSQPT